MRYNYFCLILFFSAFIVPAYCQQNDFDPTLGAKEIKIFDANGKPFVNENGDVAGSPFFIDEWKYGSITLVNKSVYSKRPLRLNFEKQEVHYLSERNIEMTLPAGYAWRVTLTDSTHTPVIQYNFQCEFPGIDLQNRKSLYRVLTEGKIMLLLSVRKTVITDKNEFSGEINSAFRTYEGYYVFTGVVIQRLKKTEAFMMELMKAQKDKIEAYVKATPPNYKSIDDIRKMIEYYNSL